MLNYFYTHVSEIIAFLLLIPLVLLMMFNRSGKDLELNSVSMQKQDVEILKDEYIQAEKRINEHNDALAGIDPSASKLGFNYHKIDNNY